LRREKSIRLPAAKSRLVSRNTGRNTDTMNAHETGGSREFPFSAEDFERVRTLIYKHAGISLSLSKRDMVYSRLARRLRAAGKNTFSSYLDWVERGNPTEWEHFVNALTTNLTYFFREEHHFPVLAEHLRMLGNRRPIKIWCNAASTGEEPYSIAMTVLEAFGDNAKHVSIIASDLDTNVLTIAQRGIYSTEKLQKVTPSRLNRFFLPAAEPSHYRVNPDLQRLIEFRRINLLETSWSVQAPLDIIFCRNVMIYFDKPTQHKILSRFLPLIQEGGRLFAGHSESFLHAAELFKPLGKTVYAPVKAR
jgi:chemotaxis protein methyltransferase CheR